MTRPGGGMWLAVVVLSALAVVPARPVAAQNAAMPDSLFDFRYRFTPVFEANSTADATYNELGARFNNTIIGINGLSVNSLLSVKEKTYRLRNRVERQKQLSNTISRPLLPGLTAGLTHLDTRQVSRAALVTGGFQDFVLNNQSLAGTVGYLSPKKGPLRWDANGALKLQDNEFAFKRDQGQGGDINGGVRYRLPGGRVRVAVRGAYGELSEKSSSVFETFDGLSTTSDSLSARVNVRAADSLDVGLSWADDSYERSFADQSRGSSGTQQIGAENLFREIERRENRRYGISMSSTPMPGLTVKANTSHSEKISDYVNTPTRYSRTVTDELRGELSYRLQSQLAVSLKLENSETLRDLGTQSVSSYTDKRQRASLTLSRPFSETLSANVTIAQGIGQQFYVRFDENPRDRDQLESSVRGTITARPFKKISTSMFLSVSSTDIVSIDASYSGDNRTRLRYDFKPNITYTINDRVKVEQAYGLAIEFTDYDYTQPGQDDFIDRSVSFRNTIRHKTTKRLSTSFEYQLTLHDRGAYLPEDPADIDDPDAERFLDVEREDRTDVIRTSMRYQVNEHLSLVADQEYSRRRDTTVGSPNDRISATGSLEGGAVGSYDWGRGRSLSFSLKRAEKFSPFITENQESYWVGNMAFKYTF